MFGEICDNNLLINKFKFKRAYIYLALVFFLYEPWQAYAVDDVIANGLKYSSMESVINVKTAGAKGDGIADDTAAIKKALTGLKKNDVKIFFPTGIYKVMETIALPSNIHIEGTGNGSCLIMGRHLKDGIIFAFGQSNITISKLAIKGRGLELKKNETERLLFFEKCSAIFIDDCDLSKSSIAIQGQTCINIIVSNCNVHDINHREDFSHGYGMLFNLSCKNIMIILNQFNNIGRHAIYISSGSSDVTIRENLVNGCESSAIGVYSKSTQKVSKNIEISFNDIRNIKGHVSPRGISIAVLCKNITLRMNKLSNIQQYGIAVEGSAIEEVEHNPSNILIDGNSIEDCHSVGIWVTNANKVMVQKNIVVATSGIVAGSIGKMKGSYLRKFSVLNNEIYYKKYSIKIGDGSRDAEFLNRNNIFKPSSDQTYFEINSGAHR